MTAFFRKLYQDFLYIPKHSKGMVREKVMLTRIALSMTVILFCMAAMSLTAYAFFSHTAYSGVETLQAASFGITVTSAEDLQPQNAVYTLDNTGGSAPRLYTFTVAKSPESTATVGYVKVLVTVEGDLQEQVFYTQPLGKFLVEEVMTEDPDRQVCLKVPAGKRVAVTFVGEWGSCSKEPILEESDVIEPVMAQDVSSATTTTTTTTTTVPETTTSVATTTTETVSPTETTQSEETQTTAPTPEEDEE